LSPRDERGQDAQADFRRQSKEPNRLWQRESQSWHVLEFLAHAQHEFFSPQQVPTIRLRSKGYWRELNLVNICAERFGVDRGKNPVPRWLDVLVLRHELASVAEGPRAKGL
jgi:hypothetical protein